MWESFVLWGQHYGLLATIILLAFIIIMMSAEKKKLFSTIEKLRIENTELKKLSNFNESSEVKNDV